MAQQDTYRCRDGRWIAITLAAPDPVIETWCATKDSSEVVADMLARGVPAALCNDGADLLRDRRWPASRSFATSAAGW